MLSETHGRKVEVTRRVVVGIPYRKIVEVAEEENSDLIVIMTHGRTGLSHLVMGSVTEKIVRTAPCPVFDDTADRCNRLVCGLGAWQIS